MLQDGQPRPRHGETVERAIILFQQIFLCLPEEFILPVVNKDRYCILILHLHTSIHAILHSTVSERLKQQVCDQIITGLTSQETRKITAENVNVQE